MQCPGTARALHASAWSRPAPRLWAERSGLVVVKIGAMGQHMLKGQHRDRSESLLINLFPVLAELVHNVGNSARLPIPERVRDQTQAPGCIHNRLLIASRAFALVGKKDAARQLVAVLALVEVARDSPLERGIGQVAQKVVRFAEPSQRGQGCG